MTDIPDDYVIVAWEYLDAVEPIDEAAGALGRSVV
jgi:hypothetical protein